MRSGVLFVFSSSIKAAPDSRGFLLRRCTLIWKNWCDLESYILHRETWILIACQTPTDMTATAAAIFFLAGSASYLLLWWVFNRPNSR